MPIFAKSIDIDTKSVINEGEIFSKNLSTNSQNSLQKINQLVNTKSLSNRVKLATYYNPEKLSNILNQKNLLQIIDKMQQIESGTKEERNLLELYLKKLSKTLNDNQDLFSDNKFRSEFFEELACILPKPKRQNLIAESEALYIQSISSNIYNQLSLGVDKIIKDLEIPEAKQERFKIDFLRNMKSSISAIVIDAKDAEKTYQKSIANLLQLNNECFNSPNKVHSFLNNLQNLFSANSSTHNGLKLEKLSEIHNKALDNPDIVFPVTLSYLKNNFLEPFEDRLQTIDDNSKANFIRDASQLIAIIPNVSQDEAAIEEYRVKMKNLLKNHNLLKDRHHIFNLIEYSMLTEKTKQSIKLVNSIINREIINEHIIDFWKETFPEKEVPEEIISKFTDELLEQKDTPSLEELLNHFDGFETMKLGDKCHENLKKLKAHLSDINIEKNPKLEDKFLELESKNLYFDIFQNSHLIARKNKLEELKELQKKHKDTVNEIDGVSVNIGDAIKEIFTNQLKELSDFSDVLYKISTCIPKYIDVNSGTVININKYSSDLAILFLKDESYQNLGAKNELYTAIEKNIEHPYKEQFNKAHQLVEDHIKSRLAIVDLQNAIKKIEPEIRSDYFKTQGDIIRDKFKKLEIEDTVFASRETILEQLFELQEMKNDIAQRCDKTSKNYEYFSKIVERTKSTLTDRYNKFDTKEYKYGKDSSIYKLIMGLKTDTLVKVLQNASKDPNSRQEQHKINIYEFILDKEDFYLNAPPELASKMQEVVHQANATKADTKIYSVIDRINKLCTEIVKLIELYSDKAIINLEEMAKDLSIDREKVDKLVKFIEDINQENLNKIFNQIESHIVGTSRADFKDDTNKFKISQRPDKDGVERITNEVDLPTLKPLKDFIGKLTKSEKREFSKLPNHSNQKVFGCYTEREMERRSRTGVVIGR